MPEIGRAISELAPDIVCLQEVFFRGDRAKIEKGLINFGYRATPGDYGLILSKLGGLVVFSKLAIAETYFKKYEEQGPFIPIFSISDRVAGKGFLHVRVNWEEEMINVIDTHVLCNYRNKRQEFRAIEKQFEELGEYINKKIKPSEKIIFCGDLNINPGSQIYENFIRKTGFYDPLNGKNESSIHVAFRRPIFRDEAERLDYTCFRNFEKSKIKQKIVFENIFLSDHMGIYSVYF